LPSEPVSWYGGCHLVLKADCRDRPRVSVQSTIVPSYILILESSCAGLNRDHLSKERLDQCEQVHLHTVSFCHGVKQGLEDGTVLLGNVI
jgi:hypothetical protein